MFWYYGNYTVQIHAVFSTCYDVIHAMERNHLFIKMLTNKLLLGLYQCESCLLKI